MCSKGLVTHGVPQSCSACSTSQLWVLGYMKQQFWRTQMSERKIFIGITLNLTTFLPLRILLHEFYILVSGLNGPCKLLRRHFIGSITQKVACNMQGHQLQPCAKGWRSWKVEGPFYNVAAVANRVSQDPVPLIKDC